LQLRAREHRDIGNLGFINIYIQKEKKKQAKTKIGWPKDAPIGKRAAPSPRDHGEWLRLSAGNPRWRPPPSHTPVLKR
jgi:hypothetical protein